MKSPERSCCNRLFAGRNARASDRFKTDSRGKDERRFQYPVSCIVGKSNTANTPSIDDDYKTQIAKSPLDQVESFRIGDKTATEK